MSSIENYNAKLEMFKSIPLDQVKRPGSIPVDVYIQEALNLYQWCQRDLEELTWKGLSRELVDDVPIRCGALRQAQSLWLKVWNAHQAGQLQWDVEGPLAIGLRDRLVNEFRFAFRNEPSLLGSLSTITRSRSKTALIQDLNELSVLGQSQQSLLAAIRFDTRQLSEAVKTAANIGIVIATASVEKKFGNGVKDIRDRAFTHLKIAVDEITAYGNFVFKENARRLAGYGSHYLRTKRRALAVEKAKAAATVVAGQLEKVS